MSEAPRRISMKSCCDRNGHQPDFRKNKREIPNDSRNARSHRMESPTVSRCSKNDKSSYRSGARNGDDPYSSDDDEIDEYRNRDHRKSRIRRDVRKPIRGSSSESDQSTDYDFRTNWDRSKPMRGRKPEKFDGKVSWETFILQFQNCAEYNRWNEKDKNAHLRWSMTGSAAQVLWGTAQINYDQLVTKLSARYSGRGVEEKFQNELRCKRKSRGESVQELAQDIQRLMAQAYPGQKSELANHLARDMFNNVLDKPELELKIRERTTRPRECNETCTKIRSVQTYCRVINK